jgi:anti-sigma factor RsiW
MGGRLVATAHGPAVLYMYDDDHGTRLVMLARPMETEQNTAMSPLAEGAVNGFAWADHGIGYSLVGPSSAEALHPIADEARHQIAHDA